MKTISIILAVSLSVIYIVILLTTLHSLFEYRRKLSSINAQINLKMETCADIITRNETLIQQIYDIAILGHSKPEFMCRKLSHLLLSDDGIEQFIKKDCIAKANICKNDIISHFESQIEGLSKKDLEFCSLICLGYPAHAMQHFYSQENSTSYYNRRKRLRTKLKIETSSTLDTYIKETIKSLTKAETDYH